MRKASVRRDLVAAAWLTALSGLAAADGLSANIALTTKYKFRGQDQSDPNKAFLPAVQGGFDYALPDSGFYVGTWNSSIDGFAHGIEMDFYGGYKGAITETLGYDVGVLQYYYPGTDASHFDTTEIYGALTWGFLSGKYSHTVSSKYFGFEDGRNTGYYEVAANYGVAEGWTLNAHVGGTRYSDDAQDAAGALPNYWDWKAGATYDLGAGFSLAGAVVGASKKGFYGDVNKTRFIVSIGKTM